MNWLLISSATGTVLQITITIYLLIKYLENKSELKAMVFVHVFLILIWPISFPLYWATVTIGDILIKMVNNED